MSEWKARRFWKQADVAPTEDGFTVLLDGRNVKTPAKALLVVPTEALARKIAAEWDAQEKEIDPTGMPYTRTANSALDKVMPQHAEVAEMIAAYGDSDLLCYRADHPAELIDRQQAEWDPMLNWAADTLGARLSPRTGVIHAPQDDEALAALAEKVTALSAFELAAFHDLVSLSGSLVLGFAAFLDAAPAERIWEISRLDETWQEEQWGPDEEASEIAELKRASFVHAKSFIELLRSNPV